ncbi:restriction endonuclease subunit S [uncultured Pseudoramibacter sp.]|jgi:type I restriction enzyme S subunit|uniref:restriction endonuclease subunit S n=1 Tax=uncultured Pseudoramibacter sp. TaxID=1623493 RepID=UPI0025F31968|nr:restriction endonuclease subunit S [uncultured Pseudoramibacter sp.]
MKYKLSEIMDIIGGGTPKTSKSEYWNGDIPWLSVKDFNNDYRYVYKTEKTITQAGLENSSTKLLKRNDSIISARGTVGEMAMIPFPMAFNQSCYGLRAKEEITDPIYLYYLIKYNVFVLKKNSHGSVFDTITRDTFDSIEVELPTLEKQKRVASILKDIDDNIELNNEINKNLQAQAQAIYTHLIIDEADESWHSGLLSDIATITMGQSPKGDTYNENGTGTVFFQGRAEFGFRFPTRRLYTTDPKRMAQDNDVLMSVRAPVGDLNVAFEDCCIGRGLGAIHSKDNHQSFVFYTMLALRDQLDIFNGEGTVFGSINRDALNSMPIRIPPREVIDKFENIVSPMDAVIRNNYEESCRLQDIRDSLLPRLMSGEIDISNVDL